MFEKIEIFDKRYSELNKKIYEPDIAANVEEYQKIMKETIEKVLVREKLSNVSVIFYTGLTVDAAHNQNATFLVRGIRNGIDYDFEENISSINEEISGLDTMYIRAGNMGNISSSMVMELFDNNYKDLSTYVPSEVWEVMRLLRGIV